MVTSKYMDRICVVAVVIALLISVVFMDGTLLGIQPQSKVLGYENKLFDTSKVHTIDILIDDWNGFLSTAESEEYSVCDVVIDGETIYDVGIRGKGNTSLSTVSSMDSERYSFKIEFDQYDSTKSYHGLDKLSLNNLIQDNTMMKDYLTYQMMNAFGAAAPLSSYAYITVNGEDWGLYLAAEAIEDSFLQRNYGNQYGDLYKPDNMNMGGGRGNGKNFDFSDLENTPNAEKFDEFGSFKKPEKPSGETLANTNSPPSPEDSGKEFSDRGKGGAGGMGSSETKLQYIDDNVSSYSTIFDSAKTTETEADKQRLISSLKDLSEGENLESVVDVDALLRYFVVHNFVVNGDSYTGSMIHNYYLYEENGQLSMIPWDYNLAYGSFMGNSADASVNDDIDSPLSVTGSDRPMIDWIFNDADYTELYHQYFKEFLDTVDVQSIISHAKGLIAPYVEKDPTKFCTYEEFEKAVETLSVFCDLRSQSVAAQLRGEEGNVDTFELDLSDMGSMGGGKGQRPESSGQRPGQFTDRANGSDNTLTAENIARPDRPTGQDHFSSMEVTRSNQTQSDSGLLFGASAVILLAGLLAAFLFRR